METTDIIYLGDNDKELLVTYNLKDETVDLPNGRTGTDKVADIIEITKGDGTDMIPVINRIRSIQKSKSSTCNIWDYIYSHISYDPY